MAKQHGPLMNTIRNPHFARWAAVLRWPVRFFYPTGRTRRTGNQPWAKWVDELSVAVRIGDRDKVYKMMATISPELAMISPRMQVNVEDMNWMVELLDGETAAWQATWYMLLAYAAAPERYYLPAELAEVADPSDSTWRRWAASGEVPGALRKGNNWLIPRGPILAMGFVTEEQLERIPSEFEASEQGDEA